jgi:2'-5' RNA ligase
MQRLFCAIKIVPDKEFLRQFKEIQGQLQYERIKWVEEFNIHVTLKFFGETEQDRIPGIIRVLEQVAAETNVFSFSLQGLGIFGSSYDPRVIWVGIEPYAGITSIMQVLRDKLNVIGIKPDRQNLVPHLTLGRIKGIKDKKMFQQIVDQNKEISSEEIRAEQIILFESILKKEGPVYLALNSFQLRK